MGMIATNTPSPPPARRAHPIRRDHLAGRDGTPGREHDRPGGHRLAMVGAIDARPPKKRPRTEICGHPPSWTREPRQTPQTTAGSRGTHHHPTDHANQNNPLGTHNRKNTRSGRRAPRWKSRSTRRDHGYGSTTSHERHRGGRRDDLDRGGQRPHHPEMRPPKVAPCRSPGPRRNGYC